MWQSLGCSSYMLILSFCFFFLLSDLYRSLTSHPVLMTLFILEQHTFKSVSSDNINIHHCNPSPRLTIAYVTVKSFNVDFSRQNEWEKFDQTDLLGCFISKSHRKFDKLSAQISFVCRRNQSMQSCKQSISCNNSNMRPVNHLCTCGQGIAVSSIISQHIYAAKQKFAVITSSKGYAVFRSAVCFKHPSIGSWPTWFNIQKYIKPLWSALEGYWGQKKFLDEIVNRLEKPQWVERGI